MKKPQVSKLQFNAEISFLRWLFTFSNYLKFKIARCLCCGSKNKTGAPFP